MTEHDCKYHMMGLYGDGLYHCVSCDHTEKSFRDDLRASWVQGMGCSVCEVTWPVDGEKPCSCEIPEYTATGERFK